LGMYPRNMISSAEIAKLIGLEHVEIIEREFILNNSPNKVIEKIICRTDPGSNSQDLFVKYGNGSSFIKEILFYDALSQKVKNLIPKLISYQINPDRYIMVVEWIEGKNPDFTKQDIVEQVFRDYGIFAVSFEKPINSYMHGDIDALINGKSYYGMNKTVDLIGDLFERKRINGILKELCHMVKLKSGIVQEIGDKDLLNIMEKMENGLWEYLMDSIYKLPLTIHPGDVSKFNTLLRKSNNKTVIVDYENMKIVPMCLLMEYIGEKDIHVPPEHFSKLALQSYLDGWNSTSENKIKWNDFYNGYICARIIYKCYLIGWWLKAEGGNRDPGKEWVLQHTNDLSLLYDLIDWKS
jgi:hypothetical protein